jgi:hypothetical protein
LTDDSPYFELPGFESIFLEESFVVAIQDSAEAFAMDLEVVLTPAHRCYVAPGPEEEHCDRVATLAFRGPQEVNWRSRFDQKFFDASNSSDRGNIDSMSVSESD